MHPNHLIFATLSDSMAHDDLIRFIDMAHNCRVRHILPQELAILAGLLLFHSWGWVTDPMRLGDRPNHGMCLFSFVN